MASRDRDVLPFRPLPAKKTTRRGKRQPRLRLVSTPADVKPDKKNQQTVIERLRVALADIMHKEDYAVVSIYDDKYFYIGVNGIIMYAIKRRSNAIFVAPRGVVDKSLPCGELPL